MSIRRNFDWSAVSKRLVEGDKKKSYEQDEGFFAPKMAEDGTFNAIVRFVPQHPDEDLPFQKVYSHGFQCDTGAWFIENCPTTIGQKCPVCMDNGKIWESNENLAKKRKRKVNFYTNLLVIKNPAQPETEGKVFKFRYGIKIHEKIMEKIAPKNPEIDEMVPVFDYEKGANFKLKIKTSVIPGFKKPVPNYDASSFAEPTPIALNGKPLTDAQIEGIDAQLHRLNYLTDKDKFKTLQQLSAIYEDKAGKALSADTSSARKETPAPSQSKVATVDDDVPVSDEDDSAFFDRLKKEAEGNK